MGKLKTLLLVIAMTVAVPAFSQTIDSISIDTLYSGRETHFTVYASGTKFTEPDTVGNYSVRWGGISINNHITYRDSVLSDTVLIAKMIGYRYNYPAQRNRISTGNQQVQIVLTEFLGYNPWGSEQFGIQTLHHFDVFVKQDEIKSVTNYFDDGKLHVMVTGTDSRFTEGTLQARISQLANSTSDPWFAHFGGIGSYDHVRYAPYGYDIPEVEVLNDTQAIFSMFHFLDITNPCNEDALFTLHGTFGSLLDTIRLQNCPEIVSIDPDSLVFGHQPSMEIVGTNTEFTKGTLGVWITQEGEKRAVVHLDIINDSLAFANYFYLPHNDPNDCNIQPELTFYRNFGSFSNDVFDHDNRNYCWEYQPIAPNSSPRGQTVSISITGANAYFEQGTMTNVQHRFRLTDYRHFDFSADSVDILDSTHFVAHFYLEDTLPCGTYALSHRISGDNLWKVYFVDSFYVDCGASISGTVFIDLDSNNVLDQGEMPLGQPNNAMVTISPGNIIKFTDANGRFHLDAAPGTYTITVRELKGTVRSVPPQPLTLTLGDTLDNLQYGLYLDPSLHDLGISINGTPAINGRFCNFSTTYTNHGSNQNNITVSVDLDTLLQYAHAVPPPDVINGQHLEWNIDSMAFLENGEITVHCDVPILDPSFLGTIVTIPANISGAFQDHDSTDNRDVFVTDVVGSYDPNDKLVKPNRGLERFDETAYTLFDEDLEYTIRFQNTGTYYAFDVRVEDTLDAHLDFTTFRLLASSHDVEYTLNNDGELTFFFDNIMLPDSNRNEPESHGYVSFTISPIDSLAEGTEIENTAHIYFDFNPAIVTNTVNNNFVSEIPLDSIPPNDTTGLISYGSYSNNILVQPNPFTNQTLIQFPNPEGTNYRLRVIDLTGRLVHEKLNIQSTQVVFDRKGLTNGLYLIELQGDKTYRTKVLIE